MNGMSRKDITEVQATIAFLLLIQVPLTIYTIVYLFDINVKIDILKCGLCKFQTLEPIEVESDDEVEN